MAASMTDSPSDVSRMNVFKTTTNEESPLDASTGKEAKPPVSDFLTVQSFTNFAA
jgi:hypothetical protein